MIVYVKRDDLHVMLSCVQKTDSYLACFCVVMYVIDSSLSFSLTNYIRVLDEISVKEHDKGLRVLNHVREREEGLTLFTDTLCELTTLHIVFRFI